MSPTLPRAVHPAAWWGWAIGMAVAVSTTTNPLPAPAGPRGRRARRRQPPRVLAVGAGVPALPVARPRHRRRAGRAPRARRPQVRHRSSCSTCPRSRSRRGRPASSSAARSTSRACSARPSSGLRLAVMIACIGAANALANPKRLLRALPARPARDRLGRRRLGVGRAPARRERPAGAAGPAAARRHQPRPPRRSRAVALPVLEDTLDRSLLLAAAMDSRGYGRAGRRAPAAPRCSPARSPSAACSRAPSGIYGVLDATDPGVARARRRSSPGWRLVGPRAVARRAARARAAPTGPTRGARAEWLTAGLRRRRRRACSSPCRAPRPEASRRCR